MDAILEDTNKFLKLGYLSFDDTQKIENKLQKRFLELFRNKLISKEVYELIRPVGSQRPRTYGLPKFHKSGIPLRPILFMCHSVQHSLAKWLVEVLNPVLEFYSRCCVKDSFYIFLYHSSTSRLYWSQFLVSFDVVSLFTNIPLDETISICTDFLYRGSSTVAFPFPEEVFIELMGTATKSMTFSFNEIMYRQIEGISLGFLNIEEENNGQLPFLDVLVERRDSSFLELVYRKPTFTGLYLNWHSFAPKSRKLNLIRCLSYRAVNICSDCKTENELKVIKDIFIDNGYPEEVIDVNIRYTYSA